MPSISQMDYIYIDVNQLNAEEVSVEAKRKIANAIDNGVGNDIVLVWVIEETNTIVKSRVICSEKSDREGGHYFIAYWDWDNSLMGLLDFDKRDIE